MGITSESLVWLQCGLFMLGAMAFVTNPTLVLSTSIQNTTTPESLPVTDNDVTTMNFNYTTGRYTPNTTLDVPTTSVVSSNPNSTVPVYPNTTDAMTSAILNTTTPTPVNPNTTLPTLPITLNPNTTMPTEPISVNPNTTIPTIPVNPNSTLPTLPITLNPNTTISTEPISVNPNITIPTVPITMNPNITISTEPISVNPNTTIPTVPITVNPNTTIPTFPITMNPNTTMSTEPISVNPNTTIPTIPVNPSTTLPTLPMSVNPNSTLSTLPITMNPNTTISTEPVSINPNTTTTVYVSVSPNATTPSAPNTTLPITVSPNATSYSTGKMRETTTERITSKAPIVPPPEYPDVPDDDAEKIIQVQIRTTAPDDCIPSINNSSVECNIFKEDFIDEVSGAYDDVDGFREVIVTNLRENVYTKHFNDIFALDVYVDHEVIYNWNQMDHSDRGLSATEIYEMTIEANVEDGSIGNLTVISCPECIIEETTELCKSDTDVTCKEGTYLDPFCINGYPLCQSQCERKDCGSYGICSQESRKPAQCSCQYSKDVLYFGENCKRSVKKLPLFIGVVVAVFLIFVVIVVLSVCLIMKIRTDHSEKDIDEGDETDSTIETVLGINNYGVVTTYETYDIKNPALELSGTKEDFEHAIANEYLEVFGGDHRHSGIEYETVKVRADQKKEENPYFWGNLESD